MDGEKAQENRMDLQGLFGKGVFCPNDGWISSGFPLMTGLAGAAHLHSSANRHSGCTTMEMRVSFIIFPVFVSIYGLWMATSTFPFLNIAVSFVGSPMSL